MTSARFSANHNTVNMTAMTFLVQLLLLLSLVPPYAEAAALTSDGLFQSAATTTTTTAITPTSADTRTTTTNNNNNNNNMFTLDVSPCPSSASVLKPCNCSADNRHIVCGLNLFEAVTLQHIFQETSRDLVAQGATSAHGTHDFPHLQFENSPLREITGTAFEQFTFLSIVFNSNLYLANIEPQAFASTANTTYFIRFDRNPQLGAEPASVYNLFALLRSMHRLETIVLHRCGLTFIPSHAFNAQDIDDHPLHRRPPQQQQHPLKYLRRLSISNNPLHTLQAFAFFGPPKIRFILLEDNGLSRVASHAFALASAASCEERFASGDSIYYNINLSGNNLTAEAFEANAFTRLTCSIEVNLQNNSIRFLAESAFKPLYSHIPRLMLKGNPFECKNCNNSWLIKSRRCPLDKNISLEYHMGMEYECEGFSLIDYVGQCRQFQQPMRDAGIPLEQLSLNEQAVVFAERFGASRLVETDRSLLPCPSDFAFANGGGLGRQPPTSKSTVLIVVLSVWSIVMSCHLIS